MMRRLAEFGPYVPMANRLILDTDGGVDDAQALLLLIAAGRAPHAITTVYGNVSLEAATENVLAILAAAGAHIEVHAGAAQPLVESRIDARHVHGEDGLGGAPRPAETRDLSGTDAVQFLTATLTAAAAAADPVDLLMVGPLTNLALALRRTPGILAGIGRLTVMGGTLQGRGNVTHVLGDLERRFRRTTRRRRFFPGQCALGLEQQLIERVLGGGGNATLQPGARRGELTERLVPAAHMELELRL